MKKKFYAYFLENESRNGICETWDECKAVVHGKKARYKSFPSLEEAKDWLAQGAKYEKKLSEELFKTKVDKEKLRSQLTNGIYFDSGTGRGIGVEVRVTDLSGRSLLDESSIKFKINQFGNLHLGHDRTNNYGELVGLFLALDIAIQKGERHIFGDSNLVIFFWSKGIYRKENLNEKTISLIEKVVEKRKEFEKIGGKIEYVSGDVNPADLGFHK